MVGPAISWTLMAYFFRSRRVKNTYALNAPAGANLKQRLTELKRLQDEGLISEQDYERKKQALLAQL